MENKVAWLAGFFEGEGHIRCSLKESNGFPQRQISFSISQKDESKEALLFVRNILLELGIDEKSISIRPYSGKPTIYTLTMQAYEPVEIVCRALWPMLSSRRKEQIQEAFLVYCEDFQPRSVSTSGRGRTGPKAYKQVYTDLCDLSTDRL